MIRPALTPAEYADAYRCWQRQQTVAASREVAGLLDQHTLRQRAAVARARAVVECHDTPDAQASRRADLLAAIRERPAA